MTGAKDHPRQAAPGGYLVTLYVNHPPEGLVRCRDPACYSNCRYGCMIGGCRMRARAAIAYRPMSPPLFSGPGALVRS